MEKAGGMTLTAALTELDVTAQQVLQRRDDARAVAALAVNFLMGSGTVVGAWLLAKSALAAQRLAADDEQFRRAKIVSCNFFAEQGLPRAHAHLRAAAAGAGEWLN